MIRMRQFFTLVALCGLCACMGDETVAQYGGADAEWQLVEIDGNPFDARATLNLAEPGKITGQAPCNRYFGTQRAPYPWFAAKGIGATRRACPDLAAEQHFLKALGDMTLSEVAGDVLILSNDAGREMVFKAIKAFQR